jgi:hypothetical protein
MADNVRDARIAMALGALEGVWRCANDLAGRVSAPSSFDSGAPVDEGTLRASVTVALLINGARYEGAGALEQAKTAVRAEIAGGRRVAIDSEISANTVYAARQHEELDWVHPKGGTAKYLERPLREQAARYHRIIALSSATAIESA